MTTGLLAYLLSTLYMHRLTAGSGCHSTRGRLWRFPSFPEGMARVPTALPIASRNSSLLRIRSQPPEGRGEDG